MGSSIQHGTIPGVPLPVSRIVFGTAIKPMTQGRGADELLDAALEHGVSAFDCARGYGRAEKNLGSWMARRGNRDQVVVITKCGNVGLLGKVSVNRAVIERELSRSLKELGTNYVNLYLLHRDDPATPVSELVEALNEQKARGRIHSFGVSNWTHARIQEANEYAAAHGLEGFSASSPNFGLARQLEDPWGSTCVSVSGPENEAARAWYAERGMPVLAYSSLGRGFFSGRFRAFDYESARRVLDAPARKGYLHEENMRRLRNAEILAERYGTTVSQIAIRYIFGSNMNLFSIISTTNPGRIQENVDASCLPLSPKDVAFLESDEA